MDLIDKQNVVFLQIRQQCCKVSRFLDRRAGCDAHIHTHLICDDSRHRRLAQTRRAVEQHVVERLAAQTRSVDADLKIFFCLFLTGIVAQQARTQRALAGVLRQDAGRCDDLLLGVFGKLMLICSLPAYCCIMARSAALMI